MTNKLKVGVILLVCAVVGVAAPLQAQVATAVVQDPGVRGGAPGAGGALPGLTAQEQSFFTASQGTFQEVDDVPGGLGPRFNMDQCSGCHAQPAVGGTSPATNPQVAVAHKAGASNPENLGFTFAVDGQPFIRANGPVREARFKSDGGVHDLFTIAGRTDAPGCTLAQPDIAGANSAGNLIARIPTPTFGGGLIESISDATIIANKHANAAAKSSAGITGHENREGNAGTITRFGWKAQNKSLQIFAGEAYLVEQGVSNEDFTQERGEPNERTGFTERVEPNTGCLFNGTPEDHTHFDAATPTGTPSDVVQFSIFMRFLNQPTPGPQNAGAQAGQNNFNSLGCNLCHTPSLTTSSSSSTALNNQTANLFSDLLVHHMGTGLSDGISQGNAAGDEFRTAPLWGVGQRIFFLHDGRTTDLLTAIRAHASAGSEANTVIQRFNALNATQQQNILDFLRSL
jgi:CxxC motif-containing protein (DUF1111 family)